MVDVDTNVGTHPELGVEDRWDAAVFLCELDYRELVVDVSGVHAGRQVCREHLVWTLGPKVLDMAEPVDHGLREVGCSQIFGEDNASDRQYQLESRLVRLRNHCVAEARTSWLEPFVRFMSSTRTRGFRQSFL